VREGSASLSHRGDAALATIHELVRRNAGTSPSHRAERDVDRRLTETVARWSASANGSQIGTPNNFDFYYEQALRRAAAF
jgi:hypothetical protein